MSLQPRSSWGCEVISESFKEIVEMMRLDAFAWVSVMSSTRDLRFDDFL